MNVRVGEIMRGTSVGQTLLSNPLLENEMPGWVSATPGTGVAVTPRIGEILPGKFPVPQNPIVDFSLGQVKAIGTTGGGCGMGSCGCGCQGGTINGGAVSGGMGTISTDFTQFTTDLSAGNYSQAFLTDTIAGIPVIGWALGMGRSDDVGCERFAEAVMQLRLGDAGDTLTDTSNLLTDETITGVPNWTILLGGVALYFLASKVGSSKAVKSVKRYRSKQKKRAKLKAELKSI